MHAASAAPRPSFQITMQPSPSTPHQTAPSPSKPSRHSTRRAGDSQLTITRGYDTPGSDRKQDDGAGSRSGTTVKSAKRKKPRHRKRRHRRQSFLGGAEDPHPAAPHASIPDAGEDISMMADQAKPQASLPFYKLGSRDLSSTSLESEALLDHRYVTLVMFPWFGI